MRAGLSEARQAVRRGNLDGALVILWNELEPARLAADRRALRGIGGLAAAVAQRGDEGQRAEAERLLAEVERAAGQEAATSALEAEVRAGGYEPVGELEHEGEPLGGERYGEEPYEEPVEAPGFRLGQLVWLLIVIGIIVVNILGQTRD